MAKVQLAYCLCHQKCRCCTFRDFTGCAYVLFQITPLWDGDKVVRKFEPKEAGSRGKPQTHTFELQDDELILV